MTRKVLIVVHQEHSTPGKVGIFLEERGYTLDRRCPNLGDPLPENLDSYDAAIVFGGPMSANDDHLDGIKAELNWLERTALPSDCPLAGICLGAQQIARVLGAKVGRHEAGVVEIGYFDVQPTGACKSFLKEPTIFFQWHTETFDIPKGAVHLAENEIFPGQAFRYRDHVYAIEFHAEMTREMVERWSSSERGAQRLIDFRGKGAQPREEHLAGFERYSEGSDRWLNHFIDNHLLVRQDKELRAAV